MLTTKANRHHSKLPPLGEVGYLTNGTNRWGEILYWNGKRQRYQCVAYPLCDNVLPYSIGIHTALFKNLRTGEVLQMSGFYFQN